ncbi:MAG: 3-deoxy-7-phosphoheptulonate synthase [Parachlamydiaceae bacterium]
MKTLTDTKMPGLDWHPYSWKNERSTHLPKYKNASHVNEVCEYLQGMADLVTVDSVRHLLDCLNSCAQGKSFILHSGECAELFSDSQEEIVSAKLSLSTSLRRTLEQELQKEVISIDRMAGQYAKPRSNRLEIKNGNCLLSYFGDIFNAIGFTSGDRDLLPDRMISAYRASEETIRCCKQFASTQTLDHHFVSHEALNLYYEAGLTRKANGHYFNLSTHLPWLGIRTAHTSPAHLNYLSGIANPIGIKIGPNTHPDKLIEIMRTLNPGNIENKLLLITRMGANHVNNHLPALIETVLKENLSALWICDPMHGNTETLNTKYKVRRLENILKELEDTFTIHEQCGTNLAGIHLEICWDHVTECIDDEVTEDSIPINYKAIVDPRLNPSQAHFVVRFVSELIRAREVIPLRVLRSVNVTQ